MIIVLLRKKAANLSVRSLYKILGRLNAEIILFIYSYKGYIILYISASIYNENQIIIKMQI